VSEERAKKSIISAKPAGFFSTVGLLSISMWSMCLCC